MEVAIIPARGGSKGLPRKNLRLLRDKPLIVYTIESSLKSRCRTIVSTEDEEIAQVSRYYGAEVIDRPSELAENGATSESVLLHAMDFIGWDASLIVMLQPTSPLRKLNDIDNAIDQTEDSLFSCCRSHNLYWTMVDGVPFPNYNFLERPRRQDFRTKYIENGSIYVMKPEILQKGNRLGGKIAMYEMSPLYSFQVDTEDDLLLLERIMD